MGKTTERMGTISVTLVGVGLLTLACGLTEEEHGVTSTGGGQSAVQRAPGAQAVLGLPVLGLPVLGLPVLGLPVL